MVENGLAVWANSDGPDKGVLIVRGQARLLEDVTAMGDLERIRGLFEALETKEALLRLIDAADVAQGVQIFIGSENELFSMAGCSMVIAPFAQLRRADRRRHRRDRADAHELRPDHSHGRLHGQGRERPVIQMTRT